MNSSATLNEARKRYRDAKGILAVTIKELEEATYDEGQSYYVDGKPYRYQGRIYKCVRWKDGGQDFIRFLYAGPEEGIFLKEIACDTHALGTFIPGIASAGMEIAAAN